MGVVRNAGSCLKANVPYFGKVLSTDCRNHSSRRSPDTARLSRCTTSPIHFHTCIADKLKSRIGISSRTGIPFRSSDIPAFRLCVFFPYILFWSKSLPCSTLIQRFTTTSIPASVKSAAASLFSIYSCIQNTFGLRRIASCAWAIT